MQLRDIIPRETNVTELRRRRELSPGYHKTTDKLKDMSKDQLRDLIALLKGAKDEAQ